MYQTKITRGLLNPNNCRKDSVTSMNKSAKLREEQQQMRLHLADLFVLLAYCFVDFLNENCCEELSENDELAILTELLNYVSITWGIDGVFIFTNEEDEEEDESEISIPVDEITDISFFYKEWSADSEKGYIIHTFDRKKSHYTYVNRCELQEYLQVISERFLNFEINAILYLNRMYNGFEKKEIDVKVARDFVQMFVEAISP